MKTSQIVRREFLRASTVGLATLAGEELLRAQPLGLPIGLELFTVRHECERDLPGTLDKVAAIGYKEVEIFDFYGRKPSELRQIIKSAGLAAPSTHMLAYVLRPSQEVADVKSRWAALTAEVAEHGVRYLGGSVGGVSTTQPLDDYKRLADLMNAAGEQCKSAGLQFAYHNLNVEFREYNGVVPYDWLLANTDQHTVQMEIDCYWLTRAGRDPVDYFKKYPGRTPLLHVKDRKPGYAPSTIPDPGPGPFTEVGNGSLDWKHILAAAPAGGLKHYYVEQDFFERPVFDSVRISYEYLKKLEL